MRWRDRRTGWTRHCICRIRWWCHCHCIGAPRWAKWWVHDIASRSNRRMFGWYRHLGRRWPRTWPRIHNNYALRTRTPVSYFVWIATIYDRPSSAWTAARIWRCSDRVCLHDGWAPVCSMFTPTPYSRWDWLLIWERCTINVLNNSLPTTTQLVDGRCISSCLFLNLLYRGCYVMAQLWLFWSKTECLGMLPWTWYQ